MADSQGASVQPNGAPRSQNRQPRRGRSSRSRGGRSRGEHRRGGGSHSTGVAATAGEATTANIASDNAAAATNESARGGRGPSGRRGARHPRGNHDRGHRTTFGTQRPFGGRLTEEPNLAGVESGALNADAPVFVPGQPVTAERKSVQDEQGGPRNHVRRRSKSTAPDLPTRIHEDISNGQYECGICTNEVLRNSKVCLTSIREAGGVLAATRQ
ncbi:hypothetical protein DL767_007140 [Monosporascus sp. MG133]|nr:hypothetical protein DL767_007140 [Monosporascus sp. MG133]